MEFYLSDDEEEDLYGSQSDQQSSSIIRLYIFFLLMFQSTFRISDSALNVLFQFLSMFLKLLSRQPGLENLSSFATQLPCSVKSAKSAYSKVREDFRRFTCCPDCSSIYEQIKARPLTEQCSYIQFPLHPMVSRRQACNTSLLKTKKNTLSVNCLEGKVGILLQKCY